MDSFSDLKLSHLFFHNYIEFLRTHRGNVSCFNNAYSIQSEKPDSTFVILGNTEKIEHFVKSFNSFYTLSNNVTIEKKLLEKGYKKTHALNFMHIDIATYLQPIKKEMEIKKASSELDFEIFSEVQARGFCETEEMYKEWFPFLRSANFRNINNENQEFYIAYINNKAVGVALALCHHHHVGIYAVTTLPEFRRKGVSTSLMNHIIYKTSGMGIKSLLLQVIHQSYAECFYTKLGFTSAFKLSVFSIKNNHIN